MRYLLLAIAIALAGQAVAQDSAPGLGHNPKSTEGFGRVRARPVRVGLALSGGAALGLAHIGVLKVLEREGIPVTAVSGNSMGSMVGGMYAAGYSAAKIESLTLGADWGMLFSSGVPFGARYLPERQQAQRYIVQLRHRNFVPSVPGGLVPLQNVEFLLMGLLSNIEYDSRFDFDSLTIPYRAVAVDLVTGRRVVFRDGRLEQAIRASIAIPGVFSPEKMNGQELVDGGVQQYLPVEPLSEFRPDFTIAVLTMKRNPETGISLIDIASRTMDVIGTEDLVHQESLADIVIEPNVDPFMHSDFAKTRGLIAAGEAAAESAMPEIRARLAGGVPVRDVRFLERRERPVVRAVYYDGLRVTRRRTARREVRTRAGERLDFDRLIDDLTRLFRTGLFDDVNYRLESVGNDSVNVIIEMSERAYGFYSLGIRYDNVDDVAVGLEVGQGNLFGTGAGIRTALDLGNPTEGRFGLTGTRLFWFPVGYRLDGYVGAIDHSYYDRDTLRSYYSTKYWGGVSEVGYILGRNAYFNVGLTAYRAEYGFPAGQLPSGLSREYVVGPQFHLETNSYHDVDFPTVGSSLRLDALYMTPLLNSTHHSFKLAVAADRAFEMSSRLLLRPGVDIGFSLGTLPWAERFLTGGAEFVGFPTDEFTTRYRTVVRLGTDFRAADLFGQPAYPLYLQAMANAGTFERQDNLVVTPQDWLSVLRWGAGLGVRTNTPVGPLQVIVGVGDFGKPQPYAGARFSFYFSVGREFRYTR
jgi:NTE family protein